MSEHTPYFRGMPDPSWNGTEMTVLLRPDAKRPVEIRLSGTCPHCDHETRFDYPIVVRDEIAARMQPLPLDALEELADVAQRLRLVRARGSAEIEVLCQCRRDHPGGPDGAAGCGASWYRFVAWGGP